MKRYDKVEIISLKDEDNLSYREDKSKEIALLVPNDYSSSKCYKVLYGFDAQNLFSKSINNPYMPSFGSWCLDKIIEKFNVKCDGIIVVGIFNGEGEAIRDSELTMSTNFGKLTSLAEEGKGFKDGHLDELGNFIRDTLIPYVDKRFSTVKSPEGRGIFGASSGGLSAYYLGLRDFGVYGAIGAFSPAMALFYHSDWLKFYNNICNSNAPDIYLYCGYGDNLEKLLIDEVKDSSKELKRMGYSGKIIECYSQLSHNEEAWREYFSDFLSLFCK